MKCNSSLLITIYKIWRKPRSGAPFPEPAERRGRKTCSRLPLRPAEGLKRLVPSSMGDFKTATKRPSFQFIPCWVGEASAHESTLRVTRCGSFALGQGQAGSPHTDRCTCRAHPAEPHSLPRELV